MQQFYEMNKNIEYVVVKINDDVIFNASSQRHLFQSMTNTDTNDIEATVSQIIELAASGAGLVRVAVPGLKEAAALHEIRRDLTRNAPTSQHKNIPLVADVHFLPEVAEQTAHFVEKIRINPGNYTDTRAKPLFDICKQNNTIIRVGVNQGSLCDRIISRYGNTPEALVASALEWMNIAEMYDYHSIVFSIKSSHVKTMMESNLLLYNKMIERRKVYPFHLGVTEVANEMEGRVKSAIGIGALLLREIGNTFRVSLTENPVNEITFSKLLVEAVQDIKKNGYDHFSEGVLQIHYPEKRRFLCVTIR